MSSPRCECKAVLDGDDICVVGGFDGDHHVGSAERVDVRKGRRSKLSTSSPAFQEQLRNRAA